MGGTPAQRKGGDLKEDTADVCETLEEVNMVWLFAYSSNTRSRGGQRKMA